MPTTNAIRRSRGVSAAAGAGRRGGRAVPSQGRADVSSHDSAGAGSPAPVLSLEEERDRRFVDLWTAGVQRAEIAKLLGFDGPDSVRRTARRLGLEKRCRAWDDAERQVLREAYAAGLSLEAIGAKLGRSAKACAAEKGRLGLRRPKVVEAVEDGAKAPASSPKFAQAGRRGALTRYQATVEPKTAQVFEMRAARLERTLADLGLTDADLRAGAYLSTQLLRRDGVDLQAAFAARVAAR